MSAAPGSRSRSGLLVKLVEQRVRDIESPRIAVIARRDDPPIVRRLRVRSPAVEVTICVLPTTLLDLHLLLAASGPYDVVVDIAGAPGVVRRLEASVLHAREGGAYLARLPRQQTDSRARRKIASLVDLATRANDEPADISARLGRGKKSKRRRDLAALVASLSELRIESDCVVASPRVSALSKIPESEHNHFLQLRCAGEHVIKTVPAVRWTSRTIVRASSPPPLNALLTVMEAPELSMREYRDVVCLPRQMMMKDNFVLPESYRGIRNARLRSPELVDLAPMFARRPSVRPQKLLGVWFHLDTEIQNHFGHAVTEQISHLWGWSEAKARHPSMRALLFAPPGDRIADWTFDLLESGGVPREQITVLDGPAQVEKLVTTTPAYSIGDFAHPLIEQTYSTIGSALAARASEREWPERVFYTRTQSKRACNNRAEVESLFATAGFEIVSPETHSMADQIRYVREAAVVGGFAGSGLLHIALAGEPKHVVVIMSESYHAYNEYMMSSIVGHRLDLVVCRPDVPRRGNHFSGESYRSNFTVDMGREGQFLQDVLASL